jgi:mutator protein MutT
VRKLGAIVVILNKDNKTLLLKRAPGDYWAAEKWGYPGGKIEAGETSEEAAVRETKEETQLHVSNLKEVGLKLDIPVNVYYTRSYTGAVKLDFEHTDWAWVDATEAAAIDLAPDTLELYKWALDNGR